MTPHAHLDAVDAAALFTGVASPCLSHAYTGTLSNSQMCLSHYDSDLRWVSHVQRQGEYQSEGCRK